MDMTDMTVREAIEMGWTLNPYTGLIARLNSKYGLGFFRSSRLVRAALELGLIHQEWRGHKHSLVGECRWRKGWR